MARHVKNSLWLLALLLAGPVQPAELYRVDSANTQVTFAVESLGIQWVSARFADIHGEIILDAAGRGSRVDVIVAIASLDSNDARWNERLRSPEWLDARRYPQMIFHSSNIQLTDDRAVATGELTLHGRTRPIVLTISLHDCTSAGVCRFSANGHIRRSEYGLPNGFFSGGDRVEIAIGGALNGAVRQAAGSDRPGQN